MRKMAGILMMLAVVPLSAYGQDESRIKDSTSLAQEKSRPERAIPPAPVTAAATADPISKAVAREVARLRRLEPALVHRPPQTGQQRGWPARHPVLTGLLIGAGAGVVFGATGPCANADVDANACPMGWAGIWGGAGALIGLAF
jgi:hypothetical protein